MKSNFAGGVLVVMLLSFGYRIQAQSYAESAGNFSRVTPGGSARIQAMGGSQIALGGDYSSSLSNPAGLGMYNRSEITLSLGFYSLKTNTNYFGHNDSENKTNLNIPGFSAVFNSTKRCGECKGFLAGSVGVTFSRVNDFNQSFVYSGHNNKNSIIDSFTGAANSNGYDTAQFAYGGDQFNTIAGLGYNNYLFSYYPAGGGYPAGYYSNLKSDSYPDQHENVQLKGATNQWNISYGANINDMFFFGAGLGISSLNYKSSKVFEEDYTTDPYVKNFVTTENLSIKGSGANFTLGTIVRPVSFLQVGLSYTTPTLYQISESWSADMSSTWTNASDNGYQYTDIIKSDYSLVTPSKLSAGVAFISKYGLITGDIETMNFSGARYSTTTTGVSYSDSNDEIKSIYRRVLNYRLGFEGRYSIFRLRGGYNLQANTYKSEFDVDNTIQSISGGVGIKTKKFSVDFALVSSKSKGIYSPYTMQNASESPSVALTNNLTRGIFTFGFTF